VVDVANLKDGDVAGLVALQDAYGYVGVKKTGTTTVGGDGQRQHPGGQRGT
jgi:hypothetical protein